MVGPFDINDIDITTNRYMIDLFFDEISGFRHALDVAAGIGRISKNVLLPKFFHVDLFEGAEVHYKFAIQHAPSVRKFYHSSMQNFEFE